MASEPDPDLEVIRAWGEVPPVACRGLCTHSCRNVSLAPAEVRYYNGHGIQIGYDFEQGCCDRLTDGRCEIYEDRPLVCRTWGASPDRPCPHGCAPTLTADQARMVTHRLFLEP